MSYSTKFDGTRFVLTVSRESDSTGTPPFALQASFDGARHDRNSEGHRRRSIQTAGGIGVVHLERNA
eukprot:9491947-Pyramimonas_sp.AAC.1